MSTSAVLEENLVDKSAAKNSAKPLKSAHLRALEAEAVHIMRETIAEARNPALLFSGGKDSIVMLRLAEKSIPSG